MFRNFGKYRKVYGHLLATYGRQWEVWVGFGLRFLTRVCLLILLPIALSLIITNLSKGDFDGAKHAVWFFAGVSFVFGVLTPLARYISILGENKGYRIITGNYFERLVSADLDYFNSNLAGYLTTATRQYADSCMIIMRSLRDRYMNTVLSILFPLLVILWLDLWLGLVALFLSLTQMIYLLWSSHLIAPYRAKTREIYKHNSGYMADVVSNILAVKATTQEVTRVERVRQGAIAENEVFRARYAVQSKLIALREAISVIFFLVLLWTVVQRMSDGAISITAAVLAATYTTTIMAAIYGLSEDLDDHDDHVDRIMPAFEILEREHTIQDPADPEELDVIRGDVGFDHVTFAYDKASAGRHVFTDFSLRIPAGQKVGVVGLSGAGKSTLARLLLRFNDVDDGRVLLDGTDVRTVRQTDVRRHISYVPQEPLLFHASVRENILLGRPEASDAEIRKALKSAHALNFVEQLPEGLESIVGERGVKLSGGQKQRTAIARAVLQGSPIMLLDEATSALDSESEQIIKDSFKQILKGKTAIVIAHRLSTLSEMDRIVVIEKGKLVEDGTHDELLAADGVYARLWRRQLKHVEDMVANSSGI